MPGRLNANTWRRHPGPGPELEDSSHNCIFFVPPLTALDKLTNLKAAAGSRLLLPSDNLTSSLAHHSAHWPRGAGAGAGSRPGTSPRPVNCAFCKFVWESAWLNISGPLFLRSCHFWPRLWPLWKLAVFCTLAGLNFFLLRFGFQFSVLFASR